MCISKSHVLLDTFALIKSIASLRHNLTAIATLCTTHNLTFSDLINDLPHTEPYFAKAVTIRSVVSSVPSSLMYTGSEQERITVDRDETKMTE